MRTELPDYERAGFDPPAPVARVRISGPHGQAVSDVPLLVDSGADVTVVPRAVADSVGALPTGRVELQAYDGTLVIETVVELTLGLEGYQFRGRFVAADVDRGVLGRNVLNALSILLDGPRMRWSVQPT